MTNTENKAVPKLRFREFEGTWNRMKLSDFITALKSGVSVNSENVQCQENEIGILKTSSINDGVFIPSQNKKIIERDIHRAKLNPQKDSIIISRMNTPKLVGQIGYVSHNYSNLFIPDRLWQTVTNDKVNVKWLSYLLITSKIKFAITSKATGTSGTMKNIAKPSFLSIPFHSPTLPEQQKIAAFLSLVDKKQEQLAKKRSLLTDYKKGVMQKIFSQELRFKDANGNNYPDWEEKKLGEVLDGIKGKGLSKEKLDDNGQFKCILYGELYTTYKEQITDIKKRTHSDEGVNSLLGDLLVPCSTTTKGIDLANVTAINEKNVKLGGDISILRSKQEINSVFFAYYLSNYKKHDLAKFGQGSTIVHLYYTHFKSIIIDIPTLEEQNKTASFLSALDVKIEQINTLTENTKSFKKGLLQQMFV